MRLAIKVLTDKVIESKSILRKQEALKEEIIERLISVQQDIRATNNDIDNLEGEIKNLSEKNRVGETLGNSRPDINQGSQGINPVFSGGFVNLKDTY